MKAKLYIRGMKEPKDLTHAEGKEAERIIADVMVVPETPFIIEGIWSGKKADMKYVDWERENQYNEKIESKISDEDFEQIKNEVEEAKHSAVSQGFKDFYYKDFWFKSKNVVRLDIKIDWKGENYYDRIILDPEGFIKCQDLFSAYEKKIWGIEKENSRLEMLAESSLY